MINVIHTKTFDNTKEESQFNNLSEWESHPYYNNPNFTNEVFDITIQAALKESLYTRDEEFSACSYVLKLVGSFNKLKPEGSVLQILSSPQMQSIILALLTGAPKTARDMILDLPLPPYTPSEISQVVAALNKVID